MEVQTPPCPSILEPQTGLNGSKLLQEQVDPARWLSPLIYQCMWVDAVDELVAVDGVMKEETNAFIIYLRPNKTDG